MMGNLREGLEYLVSLGEIENFEFGGLDYTSKQLHLVKHPTPAVINVTTLTALIDYIKSNFDTKSSDKLLIHVESPRKVSLLSELRTDRDRETYIQCSALLPDNIYFDRFIDTESFNIMLQSSFTDNKDKALLLKVTGCVKDSAIKEVGDDGVSQAATIKTGVASVNDVVVPNPVILAPYRTFPEIEQPESKFIFRMQSGPRASLFEADGGAWRNEAMQKIKTYLTDQLKDISNIQIIS